jgi:Stage II sporulation protein E (SpoIIE)
MPPLARNGRPGARVLAALPFLVLAAVAAANAWFGPMQRALLRPVPSRVGGVSMAVRYASANASAQVGGDVYEVISVGGMLRLLVADVQGQGLAAVGTAAVVLGAFREAAYDARGLAEIAARIEVSLQRREESEEFVTAVLAQIPHGGPVIDILSCGHPPPLLLTAAAARFIESADPGPGPALREPSADDHAQALPRRARPVLHRRDQRATRQVRRVLPA